MITRNGWTAFCEDYGFGLVMFVLGLCAVAIIALVAWFVYKLITG